MDSAISVVMLQGYRIFDKTENCIFFIDDLWQFRPTHIHLRKFDGGKIEIINLSENMSKIIFTYYITIIPEIIITTAFLILSFLAGYFLLIFVLPFLILLLVTIDRLKSESNKIVMKIVNLN